MRDLVHDGLRDRRPQLLVVVAGLGLDRGAIQRDPVGERRRRTRGRVCILVQTEEVGIVGRGTVLHDDRDVVHRLLDQRRELVQRVRDERPRTDVESGAASPGLRACPAGSGRISTSSTWPRATCGAGWTVRRRSPLRAGYAQGARLPRRGGASTTACGRSRDVLVRGGGPRLLEPDRVRPPRDPRLRRPRVHGRGSARSPRGIVHAKEPIIEVTAPIWRRSSSRRSC